MSVVTLVAGALVVVGLAGIVLPVLPGSLLVGLGVLVWAVAQGTLGGWLVFTAAAVLLACGWATSYVWTGRRLLAAGVPTRSLVVGALAGVVGIFVIPVVGLLVGFCAGLYLAEAARLGFGAPSWRSTQLALKTVLLSIGVELALALVAATVWVVAAWNAAT
ncbi:DUF456 domain-containing protein [Streptomyces sp. NP160]|uniref:DUF456 domain-containing protein n=1 Tax=Streptomyces sp. NP160 TaxID=2586637 RepID=UPI001118EEA5|nr:DUF456 domain-containing protein [Streptomyces sp. NP160]TNM68885.1 DUF456 domain-containing protein [Streptomyces sp. NP160]